MKKRQAKNEIIIHVNTKNAEHTLNGPCFMFYKLILACYFAFPLFIRNINWSQNMLPIQHSTTSLLFVRVFTKCKSCLRKVRSLRCDNGEILQITKKVKQSLAVWPFSMPFHEFWSGLLVLKRLFRHAELSCLQCTQFNWFWWFKWHKFRSTHKARLVWGLLMSWNYQFERIRLVRIGTAIDTVGSTINKPFHHGETQWVNTMWNTIKE